MKSSKSGVRALFKPDGKTNAKNAFILVNLGLFVIAVLWLHPTVTSWLRARELAQHQRQVYGAYSLQAREYSLSYPPEPVRNVLPYEHLAVALEDVQSLARHYGLDTMTFTAASPVGYDGSGGERFVEMRVQASFFGQYCQAGDFTYSLAGSAAFVRDMRMEFIDDEMVNLRVEFSLFGREE